METEIVERRDLPTGAPQHERLVEEFNRNGFVGDVFRPTDGIPKLRKNGHALTPGDSITPCISRLWHGSVKPAGLESRLFTRQARCSMLQGGELERDLGEWKIQESDHEVHLARI